MPGSSLLRKTIYVLLSVFIFANLSSCIFFNMASEMKKPEEDIVANYKGRKIVLGTEGGFASIRNERIILFGAVLDEDSYVLGRVYEHNSASKEYHQIKKLDGEQVHHILSLFKKASKSVRTFNHPGNMSTFMNEYNHGKMVNQYIWGEAGVAVPEKLTETYSEILKTIKSNSEMLLK